MGERSGSMRFAFVSGIICFCFWDEGFSDWPQTPGFQWPSYHSSPKKLGQGHSWPGWGCSSVGQHSWRDTATKANAEEGILLMQNKEVLGAKSGWCWQKRAWSWPDVIYSWPNRGRGSPAADAVGSLELSQKVLLLQLSLLLFSWVFFPPLPFSYLIFSSFSTHLV